MLNSISILYLLKLIVSITNTYNHQITKLLTFHIPVGVEIVKTDYIITIMNGFSMKPFMVCVWHACV